MASASTWSVKRVAKLLRQGKKDRHLDGGPGGVRGLYLEIESKTSAHWLLRYQLAGRRRDMGLGPYPEITLARAREKALEARRLVAQRLEARRRFAADPLP